MAGKVVSTRYVPVTFQVPANTPQSAPVSQLVELGEVTLDEVRLIIPPGHSGLTGLQIRFASQPIVPWDQAGAFLIGDDIHETFTVGFDVSGNIQLVGYNVDVIPHSFYLYVQISDFAVASDWGSTPIIPIS